MDVWSQRLYDGVAPTTPTTTTPTATTPFLVWLCADDADDDDDDVAPTAAVEETRGLNDWRTTLCRADTEAASCGLKDDDDDDDDVDDVDDVDAQDVAL